MREGRLRRVCGPCRPAYRSWRLDVHDRALRAIEASRVMQEAEQSSLLRDENELLQQELARRPAPRRDRSMGRCATRVCARMRTPHPATGVVRAQGGAQEEITRLRRQMQAMSA